MYKIIFLLLAAFCSQSFAEEVTRQVTGYGQTIQDAINNGLSQAIEQQFGLQFDATTVQELVVTFNNEGTDFVEQSGSVSSRKVKGNISGYDTHSQQCTSNSCEVVLSVRLYDYSAPGLPTDSRRKIAVLPFTGGKEFRKQVTRQVQDQLVQSRRFAVLDRENEKAYQTEKSLWMSEDVPISEKARMGKVLGLDYILVGNIEKAKVSRWTTSIALTGEKQNHVRTVASVRYQIITVATRQVKWSDTVSVTLNSGSLDQAANVVSSRIAGEALNNIYPMRVVGISGNQIILNQGGKTVKAGSYFRIFALGENIIDPYTNESLGQDEYRIANVKVVRVTPKMSYAKVISGHISDIKKMQIARKYTPAKQAKPTPALKENDAKVLSGGGIIL